MLQSRYNHLEAQFAQKMLTNEAYQVERSQLNKAVIILPSGTISDFCLFLFAPCSINPAF